MKRLVMRTLSVLSVLCIVILLSYHDLGSHVAYSQDGSDDQTSTLGNAVWQPNFPISPSLDPVLQHPGFATFARDNLTNWEELVAPSVKPIIPIRNGKSA